MNIVRVKLIKPNTFWFLNDLRLGPDNILSPPFDLDAADSVVREKIEKAEKQFGLIKIIPQEENKAPLLDVNKDSSGAIRYELPSITPMVIRMDGAKKEITKIDTKKEVEENMPEIASVTVSEPEVEEEEVLPPSDEDYENARVLLARNGNTIKRTIRSIKDVSMIRACIELEMYGKNREGILESLKNALTGLEK